MARIAVTFGHMLSLLETCAAFAFIGAVLLGVV